MSGVAGKSWRCPFFGYDSVRRNSMRRCIHCEGGSTVVLASRAEFDAYADAYCCSDWQRCSIARALNLHYERLEDRKHDKKR